MWTKATEWLKGILCTVFLVIVGHVQAQEGPASADSSGFVKVSYLVADPGPKAYSAFGHAALRMQCPAYGLDYCFSCELPEVGWGGVAGFFSGQLKTGFIHAPTAHYLEVYAAEGRGVTEYELGLDTEEGRRLWKLLDERVADGLATPCDYLNHGCAIECVRLVDAVLYDRTLRYGKLPFTADATRRRIVLDFLNERPWVAFFWTFMAGSEADEEVSVEARLIIPEDIGEAWLRADLVDTAGVARPMVVGKRLVSAGGAPAGAFPLSPSLLFGMLFLIVVALTCVGWHGTRLSAVLRSADMLLFAFQTVMSLFLTYLLCCSVQAATRWNWYALVFNPIPLCIWLWGLVRPFGNAARRRIIGLYACLLWLFICAAPWLMSACEPAWLLVVASMAVRCTGRFIQSEREQIQ